MKFEFQFPDVGEGIHEGTIIKWLVEEGDEIKEGDSLVEVETDKVTTEIPSPRTGKVLELRGEKGDIIHVGNVFVIIEIEGSSSEEDLSAAGGVGDSFDEEDKKQELEEKEEIIEEETAGVVGEVIASSEMIPPSTEVEERPKETTTTKKVLATPVARALAKDLGIDINTVTGTGPNGRVMKEDIRKAKDSSTKEEEVKTTVARASTEDSSVKSSEISKEEEVTRVPLTRIRKTIAERMSESRFTIPHTTAMDEIDITRLDEYRKKYKDLLKEEDIHLTYLPFILKASIVALKALPEFNASLDEEKDEMILKHFYNIGIATDTERGLMVPVVKDADRKSIVELAKDILDVTTRAKENKAELHELRGGTFSITNYGSIGGYFGIPIINYPESAILGLGRIVKKPVVIDDKIVIRKVLPISLSYDHRIIDGASGARFLNLIKELLMDPELLLLRA